MESCFCFQRWREGQGQREENNHRWNRPVWENALWCFLVPRSVAAAPHCGADMALGTARPGPHLQRGALVRERGAEERGHDAHDDLGDVLLQHRVRVLPVAGVVAGLRGKSRPRTGAQPSGRPGRRGTLGHSRTRLKRQ